jgi:hypothetical protein
MGKFVPDSTEDYLTDKQLARRWKCHEKTASKRFKNLGGSALLLHDATRFPLSEILKIEREAVNRFAARVTKQPEVFIEARKRRQKERQERLERQAARRRQAATAL